MSRVTLSTIAAELGLSKFAVSRALADKDGVSDATRHRVKTMAAELGYMRPAPTVARTALGIVFHDADLVNSELNLLIQNGFQQEAERLGYQVRLRWTRAPDDILNFARECRGLALVGPHQRESVTSVREMGIPVARQGWVDPLDAFDLVSGTDHEAAIAVGNYLLGLGHREIAYVHGRPGYRGRIERFYGLREALELHPGVRLEEMRFPTETRFTEHFLALRDAGFHPTAFYCAHDGMALTVISELLRMGYRIPEDMSVVGHGDYSAATQITPQLTTVRVQGRHIGSGLVRILDDRLAGRLPAGIALRVSLASELIVRDSAGLVGRRAEGSGGNPPPFVSAIGR